MPNREVINKKSTGQTSQQRCQACPVHVDNVEFAYSTVGQVVCRVEALDRQSGLPWVSIWVPVFLKRYLHT